MTKHTPKPKRRELTPWPPGRTQLLSYFGAKSSGSAGAGGAVGKGLAQRILDAACAAMGRDEPTMMLDGLHGGLGMTIAARLRGWACPIVCNDLYGLASNIAVVVADPAMCMQLHRAVALLPHHRTIFEQARQRISKWIAEHGGAAPTNDAERVRLAVDYFVFSWSGYPGLTGCRDADGELAFYRAINSRWEAPARQFQAATQSIAGWHALLQRDTIFEHGDVVRLLDKTPDEPGLLIYLDPPYLAETRRSGDYTLEPTAQFHADLARAASRFQKATVVVSYYAGVRLAQLYPASAGWLTVPLPKTRGMKRSAHSEVSPEVILVRSGGGCGGGRGRASARPTRGRRRAKTRA